MEQLDTYIVAEKETKSGKLILRKDGLGYGLEFWDGEQFSHKLGHFYREESGIVAMNEVEL